MTLIVQENFQICKHLPLNGDQEQKKVLPL